MKRALLALALALLAPRNADAGVDARGFVVVQRGTSQVANVTAGDGWDLYEVYHHAYADVRPQANAIELTTRSEPGAVVRFELRDGNRVVRCGDLVALAIQGAWLRWDGLKKPLELSAEVANEALSDDAYQWRIGGCRANEPLVTGKPFALVNVSAKDALVGCRRVYGPPFCWDEKQLMGLEKKEQER